MQVQNLLQTNTEFTLFVPGISTFISYYKNVKAVIHWWFTKKFLKNITKLTGEHLAWDLYVSEPVDLFEKKLRRKILPVRFFNEKSPGESF